MAKDASAGKCNITVCFGNMAFSPYPVMVGHYKNTRFAGPEVYLDRGLKGLLKQHLKADVYPGDIGTSLAVSDNALAPPGALIVGLGDFGELNADNLRITLAKAMISHGLDIYAKDRNGAICHADFSTLLIGIRSGHLNLRDCIRACMKATRDANRMLKDKVVIRNIRIYELYQPVALLAAETTIQLCKEAEFSSEFQCDSQLMVCEGGRFQNLPDSSENWPLRISIRAANGTGSQRSGTRKRGPYESELLRFTVYEESARTMDDAIAPQDAIFEDYFEMAQKGQAQDLKLGHLLFEQFIPLTTKSAVSEASSLILSLDAVTATYPWEMVANPKDQEPLACKISVVRQLADQPNAYAKRSEKNFNAVVIGDPVSGLKPLEKAKDEAIAVCSTLEQGDFKPTKLIGQAGPRNLDAIVTSRYSILHIAGHGMHGVGKDKKSAMVLGKKILLTTDLIRNLSHCPDFVFLNCCHLGARPASSKAGTKSASDDLPEAYRTRRPEIASSLAGQFIQSGAKAVIAAGWAIDDDGAAEFAKEFYSRMIAGETFGNAARYARYHVYRKKGQTNTYGAYQCYGDPDYCFPSVGKTGEQGNNNGAPKPFFVAPELAIHELQNICSDASVTSFYTDSSLKDRYDEILQRIPTQWLKNDAGVFSKLGDVERIFNNYDNAIDYYQKALESQNTEIPIKIIEKLCNMRAKRAVQTFEAAPGDKARQAAHDEIEDAIDVLQNLDKIAGRQNRLQNSTTDRDTNTTSEFAGWAFNSDRYALLGSCYKCKARISENEDEFKKALALMLENYERAYQSAVQVDDKRACIYAGINLLYCQALQNLITPGKWETGQLLQSVERFCDTLQRHNPNFWTRVLPADLALVEMVNCEQSRIAGHKAEIIEHINKSWHMGGTRRAAWVVLDHIHFMAIAVKMVGPKNDAAQSEREEAYDSVIDHVESLIGTIEETESE